MSAAIGPGSGAAAPLRWHAPVQRRPSLWRAASAGALWWAWPCGLLHSALLLAALTGSAVQGAVAMLAFAAASAPGLVLGPWLWRQLRGSAWEALAMRLGALWLVAAGAWALWHDAFGANGVGSLCIGAA